MCDNVTTALTEQDAYGINQSNLTLLNPLTTECNASDPLTQFNNYCLIPTNQDFGQVCDPNQYTQSDFLFTELAGGKIKTLEQLPVLWKSAPAVVNRKIDWVEIDNVSGNVLERFTSNTGLLSCSGQGSRMIYIDDQYDAYLNYADGTMYPVTLDLTNTSKPLMSCLSSNGNVRLIATQNEWFIWTSTSNTWTGTFVIGIITSILCWNDGSNNLWVAIASREGGVRRRLAVYQNDFVTPLWQILESGGNLNSPIGLNSDNSLIVWWSDEFAEDDMIDTIGVMTFYNINTGSSVFQSAVIVPTNLSSDIPMGTLTCRGLLSDTYVYINVCVYKTGLLKIQIPTADPSNPTILNQYDATYLTSSQNMQYQAFCAKDNSVGMYVYLQQPSGNQIDVTPEQLGSPRLWTPCISIDPTGSVIILHHSTGTFFANPSALTGRTGWSTLFDLYKPLSISDKGNPSLDENQWNPGPDWFKGKLQASSPPENFSELSTTVGLPFNFLAWHQEYKFTVEVFIGPEVGSSLRAPCIRDTMWPLYRANEVFMIRNQSYTSTLSNDGNIQIRNTKTLALIWTNNMHDNQNSRTISTTINLTRPTLPPNGQYIAFWSSDGTFTISYYAYNSTRFRDYGLTSNNIFQASILAQGNFCFLNLLLDTQDPYSYKFADDRCACLGGKPLFERVFKNLDLIPTVEKETIVQNLGCLLSDCISSRLNRDPTNSSRYWEGKCNLKLTLCSNIIRSTTAISNIDVNSNCGSNYSECLSNVDCPVGNSCSNGRCLNVCNTVYDCNNSGQIVFNCENNKCVPVKNLSSGTDNGLIIALITSACIVVVIIIIVLCWYFLVKKKHK